MQENFIEGGKSLSVRFTEEEAEFFNENYERITGTGERLTLREFFKRAIDKAVTMVAPKVAQLSRPEDAAEIESLRAQLAEAGADIDTKAKFISEITAQNVELDTRVSALMEEVDKNAETIRALRELAALPADVLALDVSDAERALINDYAALMKTTAKDVLVNRLFITTVLDGPGDYIPQLKSGVRANLKKIFRK